jgi:hypothetical protein
MKGALLAQLGRTDEARAAFDRAIALARTPRRGSACSNAVGPSAPADGADGQPSAREDE